MATSASTDVRALGHIAVTGAGEEQPPTRTAGTVAAVTAALAAAALVVGVGGGLVRSTGTRTDPAAALLPARQLEVNARTVARRRVGTGR